MRKHDVPTLDRSEGPCADCAHPGTVHRGMNLPPAHRRSTVALGPTACDRCMCQAYVGTTVIRGDMSPELKK